MPGTRKATVAEQPPFDGNRPARVAADRGDCATLISSRLKRLLAASGALRVVMGALPTSRVTS
jgi:hypothetical protein